MNHRTTYTIKSARIARKLRGMGAMGYIISDERQFVYNAVYFKNHGLDFEALCHSGKILMAFPSTMSARQIRRIISREIHRD